MGARRFILGKSLASDWPRSLQEFDLGGLSRAEFWGFGRFVLSWFGRIILGKSLDSDWLRSLQEFTGVCEVIKLSAYHRKSDLNR